MDKKFTKECVVSALKNLLKEKSYDDITLSEIAEKAGVSRNAIYRNFETKDKMIKAIRIINKLQVTPITLEDIVIDNVYTR